MKKDREALIIQDTTLCKNCSAFEHSHSADFCRIGEVVEGVINPGTMNHDCPIFKAARDLTINRVAPLLSEIVQQISLNNNPN